MKYYIKRDLNEYGPYTLADLQRYVAQGNIQMSDLTRSEGLTDWVPVSQVIGNIPVPVPTTAIPGAAGTLYGGTPATGAVSSGVGGYGAAVAPAMTAGPVPPDFHWALVFLIGFVTCGLFTYVWLFVEAAFIRKIVPQSKGLLFMVLAVSGLFVGEFINISVVVANRGAANPGAALLALILILAGAVMGLVGIFTMRSDLQTYYTTTENIGLSLSGVMTFFFAVYYFQHHFTRIAQWKKTGILQPQG
jgi:GYF domain 2